MSSGRRVQLEPAFLLHHRPYRDSSRIVEFYAHEHGRVSLFAKGARRAGSALAPVLQPFVPLLVSWTGSGDGGTLTGAELAATPAPLPPARLMSGFYLNELLLKLLARQDAHAALFDSYAEAVASLQGADDAGVQITLRSFELALLRELGVLPELDQVTLTVTPVHATGRYSLHAESGVVVASAGETGVPGQALVAIEAALASGHGPALRAATAPVLAALRGPLREVLHYHLGSPQLRTRQVMADVRKLIDRENIRP